MSFQTYTIPPFYDRGLYLGESEEVTEKKLLTGQTVLKKYLPDSLWEKWNVYGYTTSLQWETDEWTYFFALSTEHTFPGSSCVRDLSYQEKLRLHHFGKREDVTADEISCLGVNVYDRALLYHFYELEPSERIHPNYSIEIGDIRQDTCIDSLTNSFYEYAKGPMGWGDLSLEVIEEGEVYSSRWSPFAKMIALKRARPRSPFVKELETELHPEIEKVVNFFRKREETNDWII